MASAVEICTSGEDAFYDAETEPPAYRAHELVYEGDLDTLREHVEEHPSELHLLDPRGHTPMHVAVLRHSLHAVRLLLRAGYDLGVKSAAGWTALEDAVALADRPIVRELLQASHAAQLAMWRAKKPFVLAALQDMPDFTMRLSWEFGAPVLSSLVKEWAPYDEYAIYKVGSRLRVDASIVGFEGTKWVRGNVSLRFDGGAEEGELCIVDHEQRKVFVKEAGTFSTGAEAESLDGEVEMLLEQEVAQLAVRTRNTTFEPVRMRLREGMRTEQVGAWSTVLYSASSDLEIEKKSKTGRAKALPETFAEYLSAPGADEGGRAGRAGWRRRQSPSEEEEVQVIKKRATGRANMAAGFPISAEQLVHLLEMLAPLNREVAKARSFLEEKVPDGLFPVQMQIPVSMGVHLQIAFPHFELVGTGGDPAWWHVPESYERSSLVEQLQALGEKIDQLAVQEEARQAAASAEEGPPARPALQASADAHVDDDDDDDAAVALADLAEADADALLAERAG